MTLPALFETNLTLRQRLEESLRALRDAHADVVELHAERAERAAAAARRGRVDGHALRTPLHTILGLTHMLLDERSDALTAEQQKQIGFVLAAAKELHEIVDARIDAADALATPIVVVLAGTDANARAVVGALQADDDMRAIPIVTVGATSRSATGAHAPSEAREPASDRDEIGSRVTSALHRAGFDARDTGVE